MDFLKEGGHEGTFQGDNSDSYLILCGGYTGIITTVIVHYLEH